MPMIEEMDVDTLVVNHIQFTTDDSLNSNILESEIINAIKSLKNNKAPGPDNIIGEFYKSSIHKMLPFLTKYCNYIFDKGLFPEECTMAILQPLHKKGDSNNVDNFRGI